MKKISSISRSGRFAREIDADVAKFTQSISFDWRLWRHDILGSMAHAEMLHKIGVLKKNELYT
ncbi:MAG: argininosuccinate lyase, partial [Limisphaerales bacterium]